MSTVDPIEKSILVEWAEIEWAAAARWFQASYLK